MEKSFKEERIRKITQLYYSRPEIQKTIYEFCKNREISPRYFQGFGKRPDAFQYPNDILQFAKKGATSFHCSEELWSDPLQIVTGMNESQYNQLRIGWDLLIDIDCKWIEYSKLAAKAVVAVLQKHGIKGISVKFSGSKGFHVLVPFKAFPKEIAGEQTTALFPELPRKLIAYLRHQSEKELKNLLPEDFYEQFKGVKIKKGIKCNGCGEIAEEYELIDFFCPTCNQGEQRRIKKDSQNLEFKCPCCKKKYESMTSRELFVCNKCNLTSKENPSAFSTSVQIDLFELMGLDLILVSPRHLFRTPYSLHEKTALASIVLTLEELDKFDLKDASPLLAQPKSFLPPCEEGEAKSFVIHALDWYSENQPEESEEKITGKYADFKPIKLTNFSENNLPPCIQKLLKGIDDGKKRALFALINLFRSIGMEKELLEKKIYEWNQKNQTPLREGYIKAQLSWAYKRKPLLPPNCKEFYKGIGVCNPDGYCQFVKNPVNYTIKKSLSGKKKTKKKFTKNKRI